MFSGLGFRSVSDDLQREISNYTKQYEPGLFDQVLRVLLGMSNEIEGINGEFSFNMNEFRFLTSNDKLNDRVSIIIPCKSISESLRTNIDSIFLKFNYKPISSHYFPELKELRLDYKI
jgi:hypothetical protein